MKTEILKTALAEYGVEIQFYFDRVHYYLDGATPEADLQPLIKSKPIREDLEKNNKLGWYVLPRYVHLDRKLELFQLHENDLANILKIEGDYRINYVEFSMDFLCPDEKVFNLISNFFYQHLVSISDNKPQFKMNTHEDGGNIFYFNHSGNKKRLLHYRDDKNMGRMSPKKTVCFHLEYRVRGIKELKNLGVFTSQDLVNFQHENLWDSLLDLRVCNNTKLGKFFYTHKEVTSKTLGKKGKAEAGNIQHLQKYISENPERISAFSKMTKAKLKKLNQPKVKTVD